MRLLKLMVYGLLGYMIYEMVQGMRSGAGMMNAGSDQGGRRRDSRGRFMPTEESSGQNMTGPGEGREEEVADAYTGTRTRHRVGRGVV